MADYVAGRGTTALATVGTVLGSIGTAGALGNGNLLGGLFGNGNGNCREPMVSRFELEQEQRIAELKSQVALRDANTYSDQKLLTLWEKIDGELKDIRQTSCDKWAAQGIINAKVDSGLATLNANLAGITATVDSITRTAVPRSAICDFGHCGCSGGGYNNI
jgi:hypothetical protein